MTHPREEKRQERKDSFVLSVALAISNVYLQEIIKLQYIIVNRDILASFPLRPPHTFQEVFRNPLLTAGQLLDSFAQYKIRQEVIFK